MNYKKFYLVYFEVGYLNLYYLMTNYWSINFKVLWINDKIILHWETKWYHDTFLFNKYDKTTEQTNSDYNFLSNFEFELLII